MAATSVQLFLGSDGSELDLNYDDVTLLGTSFTFIVPQSLGAPLTVNATIRDYNGGAPVTFQAPPSSQNGQFTFPSPLVGARTARGISWGISQIQFGTVGTFPAQGNAVVHVTPHG